jgi:ribosomal protein S18 acetylase RimI-like enzyme
VQSPGHYTYFQAYWQTTLTVRQFAGIYEAMIREFNGSLADAEGLLAVEQATFDECPYTAQEVRAMLQSGSPQLAWLAIEDDTPFGRRSPLREHVAGFVIAFPVSSLQGAWWEIDLVAVHPDRQGRGLGRQLIQTATAGGEGLASRSRAVVAADNRCSARAFACAGFQGEPTACTLLIRRLDERKPSPQPTPGISVHEAASAAEAAGWQVPLLASWGVEDLELAETAQKQNITHPLPSGGDKSQNHRGSTLLLAEHLGRPAGYAELIEVETLLYRGIWIESLAASSRAVRETLVYNAMNRATTAGLDEVSAMVPRENQPLRHTLLAAGFRSLGAYRWFSADLPPGDL